MPTDEEQAPESFEEAYRFWAYELRKAEMRGAATQGMLLGLAEAIVIVIQSRFDTVPPDITKKLLETKAEVIQEVLAHVATDSLEQVRARLGVCCARPSLAGERAGVTFGVDRSWRGTPTSLWMLW